MPSDVSANLEAAKAYATQAQNLANGYAQQLSAAVSSDYYQGIVDDLEWKSEDNDDLQRPAEYGVGVIDDLVIPGFDASFLNDWDPVNNVLMVRYDSDFLETLEQGCRGILAGNIPGFTESAAVALYGYREERDRQDLSLALEEADVTFGARRGFPIPPDAVAFHKQPILRRFADAKTDAAREKTATLAERLTDMVKAAMANGVQIENLRSDVITKMSNLYLEKIRAQVLVYETNTRALVAAFEGKIAEARIKIENNQANVANYGQWQSLIERNWEFQKEVNLKTTELRMNQAKDEITARVQAMERVMNFYATTVTAALNTAQAFDMRSTSVEEA